MTTSNDKISLAITTYNRCEMTLESFEQVLYDERIDDIVIVDDFSDFEIFNKLAEAIKGMPRVKLIRNLINIDCYANKLRAISICKNDWVIILDSDNIINKAFIDRIYKERLSSGTWTKDFIYAPDFAKPKFDYTRLSGNILTRVNISHTMEFWPEVINLMNTCNYFVNKSEYMRIHDNSINPHTYDTIFHAYNWLNAGNSIKVVPGLEYEHRLHDESHFIVNGHKTGGFAETLITKLKALR